MASSQEQPGDCDNTVTSWSNVDVFIVTYNAGKALIDVPLLSTNIYNALKDRRSLPELVVFSLQEMAPLAQSFIGGQMVRPYFQQYGKALNAAAHQLAKSSPSSPPKYSVVKCRNVGMTGIMVMTSKQDSVHGIQEAEVGFGAGDMANKGAVAVRLSFDKETPHGRQRTAELTFVATHLMHQEWNVERRRKNWESIVSGLVFEDPLRFTERRSSVPEAFDDNNGDPGDQVSIASNHDSPGEDSPLIKNDVPDRREALHQISIYKRGTHLFIAGDLNYRISGSSPGPGAVFPSLKPGSPNHFSRFLQLDQLKAEMNKGRVFQGLSEAPIHFPPTYKMKFAPHDPDDERFEGTALVASNDRRGDKPVGWKWSGHRWPSWCDRILYSEIPNRCWATMNQDLTKKLPSEIPAMSAVAYNAMSPMTTSDHCPVYLRMLVPVIEPKYLSPEEIVALDSSLTESEMARARELEEEMDQEASAQKIANPRILLPYEIDPHAWDYRAKVKRWEWIVGWSMLVGQSRNTIIVTAAALLAATLGAWWYGRFSSMVHRG